MTDSRVGITKRLDMLTAALAGTSPSVVIGDQDRKWATQSRRLTMDLIIDELWRRHKYAPDLLNESVNLPHAGDAAVDVEDACLFVAVFAREYGIRCRFTMARYYRACWTVFVAYENEEGLWMNINVLRQKTDQVPNELVMGPIFGESR